MDKKNLLFIFALVFIFLIVYSPHFANPLPFHFDEWTHISKATKIREQGLNYFFNNSPVQIGFDIILVLISFFVNLIFIYRFLPAINAMIISFILYIFLRKKFNYWTGLVSIIFLASLRTNVNILGLWFYVPIIAAIVFDYLCLFYLEKSIKKDNPKNIYLVALFLFLIAFIHQSSFLIIFLVVIIYLLFNYKFVIKYYKYFLPFLILIIPATLTLPFLGVKSLSSLINEIIWLPAVTQIYYNPFLFYGLLSSIFAGIGYYLCYKQKKLLTFRIYILIPLINLLVLFPIKKFTIFSAYQRYLYHFMIAAVPLSAAGFYYSIKFIKNKLGKYGKNLSYIIIGSILLFSFIAIFYNYYDLNPRARLYYSVFPSEYEALQSLKDYPKGKVLTLIRIGAAMPAINGNDAVFDFEDFEATESLYNFYEGDYELKKEYLYNDYFTSDDIDYVHSKEPINCSFLEEIYQNAYQNNSNYIYKVELKKDKLFFINRTINFTNIVNTISVSSDDFKLYNFTFYAWIKPVNGILENSQIIILEQIFKNEDFDVWKFGFGNNKLRVIWMENKKLLGTTDISKDKWTFITLTHDENFSIYVNGKLDATINANYCYNGHIDMRIEKIKGEMREIVLDDYSYSADEIRRLYLEQKKQLFNQR
jgi:hypothetical protein